MVKGLRLRTIDEPLQHNRPIANPSQCAWRHREIVADKVQLGQTCLLGKVELLRMRNANILARDREHLRSIILLCARHTFSKNKRVGPIRSKGAMTSRAAYTTLSTMSILLRVAFE